MLVEKLHVYKSFKACYQDFWEEDFANIGKTIEQVVLDTYQNWWSKDKEEKYGCVVIDIKLI